MRCPPAALAEPPLEYHCRVCFPCASFPTAEEALGHCAMLTHRPGPGDLYWIAAERAWAPLRKAEEKRAVLMDVRKIRGALFDLAPKSTSRSSSPSRAQACSAIAAKLGVILWEPHDAGRMDVNLEAFADMHAEHLGAEHCATLAIVALRGSVLGQARCVSGGLCVAPFRSSPFAA